MKLRKRDLLTITVVGAALAVLIMSTGREKAKPVPVDDKHRSSYEAMKKSTNRTEVEKACATCHNTQSIPLPKKHPPKEQCLICHKMSSF